MQESKQVRAKCSSCGYTIEYAETDVVQVWYHSCYGQGQSRFDPIIDPFIAWTKKVREESINGT